MVGTFAMSKHQLVDFCLGSFPTDDLFRLQPKLLPSEIAPCIDAPVIDHLDNILGVLILFSKLPLDSIACIGLRLLLLIGLRSIDVYFLMLPSACK